MKNKIFFPYFACIFIAFFISGCTSIRPQQKNLDALNNNPLAFSYSPYAKVLDEYVDKEGFVDYGMLKKNSGDIELFYATLASISPDSHPELFPNDNDRLAYWINAYNATVILGVLQYYPISSVESVEEPLLLSFFPSKSGFFLFQRYTYGGVETSLYYLENSVIRKRFSDPRYHFALNCASMSCPKLSRSPFYPQTLDRQLNDAARDFLNDKANLRFDEGRQILYISSIFDWYKKDFINWQKTKHPEKQPTLISYVLPFLRQEQAAKITGGEAITIEYLPYDWGLNDQNRQ